MIKESVGTGVGKFSDLSDSKMEFSLAPMIMTSVPDTPNTLASKSILYEKITHIFMTIGIPAHVKGYHFLREAVQIAIGNFDVLNGIMKKLYPLVASRFNTRACIVERNIRNAIEIAFNRDKIINLNNIFGIDIFGHNDKPTNSELIALLVEKVYLDCNMQAI